MVIEGKMKQLKAAPSAERRDTTQTSSCSGKGQQRKSKAFAADAKASVERSGENNPEFRDKAGN
jgi:hypothetical protein